MPEDPSYLPETDSLEQEDEWSDEDWSDNVVPADEALRALQDTLALEGRDLEAWEDESLLEWEAEEEEIPVVPSSPTTEEAIAWLQPAWRRLSSIWLRILRGLRTQIPALAKMSNGVLSALLIALLVMILTILGGVGRPTQATVSGAEKSLASRQIQPMTPGTRPSLAAESNPGVTQPPVAGDVTSLPGSEGGDLPGDRIASIQAQLTDQSLPLARGVVQAVQVDFGENRLIAVLAEDWYRLSKYDQAELANQLLARSRTLAFDDLILQTETGEILARKPIVGSGMVILHYEKPPEVPVPPKPRFRITVDR